MTWTKLSDDYSDDCWTLSDRAFRLHTEALVWNNRKLLDLKIPKDDIRRFAKDPDAIEELLAVGFWTELDMVYIIRHHAAYQRTREQVVKQQSVSRANGIKGGRPPKPSREQVEDLGTTGTQPGNPAGLETQPGNPAANLEGQDRTGLDEEVLSSQENDRSDDLDDLEAQMVEEQVIEVDSEQVEVENNISAAESVEFDWYGHLGKQEVS